MCRYRPQRWVHSSGQASGPSGQASSRVVKPRDHNARSQGLLK
eukprot:CAMPEP_0173068924 /NCGR_PEP_ID=MMETSP1102-20130122/7703_1 /TAXON_ID=49646 /ORGANISM="Geminigera sp., Strain Caron Lab Isolate" /LENGTH=42 /DNA_ID= /DNA_START= /DNA_END= /DNA_ORIENTATION=